MYALGWLGHSFGSLFLSRPFSPFSILFLHCTLLKLETEPTDKEKQQRRTKNTDKEDGMAVCINHCALYIWSFRPIASAFLIQRIRFARNELKKEAKATEHTRATAPNIIMTFMRLWLSCTTDFFLLLLSLSLTSICRRSCYLLASNLEKHK